MARLFVQYLNRQSRVREGRPSASESLLSILTGMVAAHESGDESSVDMMIGKMHEVGMFIPETVRISFDPAFPNINLLHLKSGEQVQLKFSDPKLKNWYGKDTSMYVDVRAWMDGTLQFLSRVPDQGW